MCKYTRKVEIMECDYFCQLPPSQVLMHCLNTTLIDIDAAGCGKKAIHDVLGAVWMISRMRFFQYAPIVPEDILVYHTYPRIIERSHYVYEVNIYRGEELVIRFDCAYIPVHETERHVIRPSQMEPMWREAPLDKHSDLGRLRIDGDFEPCGSDVVRRSDCDSNRHLTSTAYLSLACDALGFWESETPRIMKMMQVDYASEVLPGTLLRFERMERDGIKYVRGVKPDGKTAFTAACDF